MRGILWRRALRGRFLTHDHDGEARHERGDGSDGGEHGGEDGANGRDCYGNLDEGVTLLVFYDNALDVSFVNESADLIHQVAPEYLDLFDKVL